MEHFFPEPLAYNAVDDEVNTGVDDHGEVGEVSDEPYGVRGLEVAANLITSVNKFIEVELIFSQNT